MRTVLLFYEFSQRGSREHLLFRVGVTEVLFFAQRWRPF
jgi:hypothetical protein